MHPLDPRLTKEQESIVRLGGKRYCHNPAGITKAVMNPCGRLCELWVTKPITSNDEDNPAPVYLICPTCGIVKWSDSHWPATPSPHR